MLLSGIFDGYQSPAKSLISGHMTPQERMAPRRRDRLTRYEQIIPAPTYVRLKSKKNLTSQKSERSESGEIVTSQEQI
jgi:hypothetical protein